MEEVIHYLWRYFAKFCLSSQIDDRGPIVSGSQQLWQLILLVTRILKVDSFVIVLVVLFTDLAQFLTWYVHVTNCLPGAKYKQNPDQAVVMEKLLPNPRTWFAT